MRRSRLDSVLGTTLRALRREACTDAELLTRFLDLKEEAAFEVLIRRHAPAVRAACRSWLRTEADIDDAAQATFLILVQRGQSIRDRTAVGRWLYGVAAKVARRLRQQHKSAQPLPADLPGRPAAADEGLRDLLAEEIARLPEKYRLPVQLCYVAGLTTAEAAQRLGWPKGTVLTRLAWARERLQKNLLRRGVTPAVLAGVLIGSTSRAVNADWLRVTTKAAMGMLAGESPIRMRISGEVVSLMEGVVRTMIYERVKYIALAALLVAGLAGFGIGHWAAAANGDREGSKLAANDAETRKPFRVPQRVAKETEEEEPPAAIKGKEREKADEGRPAAPGRRREAVIRLPLGTYTKEVDAGSYGHGRLSWTYEEDRVLGLIEANVMGGEVELATEAEISLSSTGTVYGLITSVHLNHFRFPDSGELAEGFAELRPFIGLYPLVEPLISETLMDVPFSYQFRIKGDHLVLSNFRILLAGPNPAGKLGGLALGEVGVVLSCFQALAVALEGTYTSADAPEHAPPKKRQRFSKPTGRVGEGLPKLPLKRTRTSRQLGIPAAAPSVGATAVTPGVPAATSIPPAAGTPASP